MDLLYKICPRDLWQAAGRAGVFDGAPVDHRDGFIHLSTAAQVAETARLHFADADDLLLVAVRADDLGPPLRFEPSRGGDLFPHLHGPLALDAVAWTAPLPRGADGAHRFPDLATGEPAAP